MTESKFHSIVPELHLTSHLSSSWQNRFAKAIHAINQNLAEPLQWNSIASQCAVSSYHFHRMFRLVFDETPGQYQARARLQWATMLLVDEPLFSITEIAHQSGFSSSQALAKALQRSLGLSAKEIRQSAKQIDLLEHLFAKLGHPDKKTGACLEQSLAATLPITEVCLSSLDLNLRQLPSPSLYSTAEAWRKLSPPQGAKLVSLLRDVASTDTQMDLEVSVGYETPNKQLSNFHIDSKRYLCAQIAVSSEAGYVAAWDALYNHMLFSGIEPSREMFGLEILENPESLMTEYSNMSLYLAIT